MTLKITPMSAAGFGVARSHNVKDGAGLAQSETMGMHDSVDYTENPELPNEVDKTSLSTGRLDGACPYEDLYVYVLNGILAPSYEPQLGADFMGNWVEDETSFLFFSAPGENHIEGVLGALDGLKVSEKHVFPYETWQGGAVEPVRVDDFVIVPPWLDSAGVLYGTWVVSLASMRCGHLLLGFR